MDLGTACPKLLARCRKSDCTLGEFAERARNFLFELIPLHPGFSDLRLVGKSIKDSPPLAADLSNLKDWILRRAWMDRLPIGCEYTNLDLDGRPTLDSRSGLGFELGVSNLKGWDGKVDISFSDGNRESAICNIVLPRKDHPEFQQSALMRKMLEVVVRHSSVYYASVANGGWHNAVNWLEEQATDNLRNIEVGWLTYVEDASIADALPSDIAVQPLGHGVMFQLCERFLSYERPEDVALGLRVKGALAAAGKLGVVPARPGQGMSSSGAVSL